MQHRFDVLGSPAVADARKQERSADRTPRPHGRSPRSPPSLQTSETFQNDARRCVRRTAQLALAQSIIDGCAGAGERSIELFHQLGGARVLGADHHAIRFHEIVDRGALLQELRVADDAEGVRGFAPDDFPDLGRRADRHRALVHHDLIAIHRARELTRHGEHVLQVLRVLLSGGCADCDHDNLRAADPLRAPGP